MRLRRKKLACVGQNEKNDNRKQKDRNAVRILRKQRREGSEKPFFPLLLSFASHCIPPGFSFYQKRSYASGLRENAIPKSAERPNLKTVVRSRIPGLNTAAATDGASRLRFIYRFFI